MSSNQSLLRKADMAIADLQQQGGELQPDEGASFIRKLIVQPTLMQQARIVEMNGPRRRINRIGFGARILRKATSATALTQSQRSKPTMDQLTLDTKEQIAEVRLPYDVLEDNIERATNVANNGASNTGPGGLRQTIIELIAERAAADMEELAILADVDYVNDADQDDEDYLSQLDGWLETAKENGNTVDWEGKPVSKELFKEGKKLLPKQFLRNLPAMRHFVSPNQHTEYQDTLANRGTALGDTNIQGVPQLNAYGSPVEAISHMPERNGLFTNPKNLIFGIQRQVSMEFDKDITARVYIIVLTARLDFQIEEPEAVIYYDDIGEAA